MPQVPTYDSFQVAPQALPDARVADVQPGDAALQIGKAFSSSGADFTDSAIRLQHQQNADRVFQAEASFKDGLLQQQNSIQQAKGQDAWGATDATHKWLDENLRKSADGLENDQQREIFLRTMAPVRFQTLESTSRYEQQQRQQSITDTANASIGGSINLAAASPSDPNVIAQSKSDILKRLQVVGQLNGWTPEISDAARTEQLTKLHTQVIGSLVDKNPTQAAAYLDANRGEIAGSKLDELDKAVRVGTITQQSQTATADILSRHSSESDALAEARSKFSGPVQDAITTRIREQFGEANTIRERDQKDAGDQGWKLMTQKGIDAIPPSLITRMSGDTYKAIQDEAARRSKGTNVETDWATFQQLRTQTFANPNNPPSIIPYLGSLGEGERKSLIDLQTSLLAPNTRHDAVTVEKQLNDAITQLGYPKSPNKVQRETIGQLKAQADQAFIDFQTKNGRKPIDTERGAIIDSLMQPGTIPGRIFGTNDARRIEAVASGKQSQFTPNPPAEGDRQLSKSGKPMVFNGGKWQYVQ